MTRKTKMLGLRLDTQLIEDYRNACEGLPIMFKHKSLIESYMQYIIDSEKYYRETGKLKLGFITFNNNVVLYNQEGRQESIDYEIEE